MRALPALSLVVVGSAGNAGAQSFNVDVGMNLSIFAPTPDPTYAGAAGQPGHWDAFLPTFTATPLEGLDASPSAVTLRSDSTSTYTVFPGVMTPGDDQRLMEDFHLTPNLNGASTWTFAGLENGDYTLFTYASDPTSATLLTDVSVAGSTDPQQRVGAGWPGAHALGATYAEHDVAVTDGTLVVVAEPVGGQFETGVLNGFQLVRRGSGGPGTNACTAAPNSSGAPASMGATGSASAAANDLTLACGGMPANAFGFFLVSRAAGFTANPGGSAGNLCLAGAIGRYVGPGEIQNSGAAGAIALPVDLGSTPTPTGFVAVQAGETWHFTAWFRDVGPTSNFADRYTVVFH